MGNYVQNRVSCNAFKLYVSLKCNVQPKIKFIGSVRKFYENSNRKIIKKHFPIFTFPKMFVVIDKFSEQKSI